MDQKKELKQLYKETKIEAGVYQIKNTVNQKLFIGSTPNFKTLNGVKFSLNTGVYMNKALQEEWNTFGKEAFQIDILETLKKKEGPFYNAKEALMELEDKWLGCLQPYDEQGYNVKKPS
ncbi:GIY-YIG nuclease family protein [Sporosarcina newyorkensis]|uniref:GIY-YIG catalytic domain-containing protein n=1 Tax=Sporosarcina newyorkensis TaxID=759851 RepID=A0A1T4XHC6_9BACL|nr:GIY-YIG nuclease family protein [Sporosarcina newyorkensis]SKA89012.1 GIY-YIG catalytic domain-containing protein [Sporosarcina newyorkensis]